MASASKDRSSTRMEPADMPHLLLGRYRVLEERGHGGFGTVSVCWDPRLMRRVAIKTISLHPQSEQAQALLRGALAESRTASMLAHPNIVSMLDFEADAQSAYIIMEYVEGASLSELLDATDDHMLTFDEAACVAEAVGEALSYAHDNGVLHLDIKPDNILIDESGRVRLADFGMATLSSATGYGGPTGGTVGYMPPEQILVGAVDVRTDVFAFASVMYEALTGARPFAAPTPEESLDLVCGVLADPCALNEDIPAQAADALLRALDPDPEGRQESVAEFTDELRRGLGSPRAGRRSLAGLVQDVTSDEMTEQDWQTRPTAGLPGGAGGQGVAPGLGGAQAGAARTPGSDAGPEQFPVSEYGVLTKALPRSPSVALRALAAGSAGLMAGVSVLALVGATSTNAAIAAPIAAWVAGLVTGGVGLAAPQLAAALALAALVAACFGLQLWALAPVLLVLAGAWWALVARSEPFASGAPLSAALALNPATPIPAQLSGLIMTPAHATLSAALSFVVALALASLAGSPSLGPLDPASFAQSNPQAAASALVELVKNPQVWAEGVGWVGAAAALSALASNGGFGRCYLGSFCALVICAGVQAGVACVELGPAWTLPQTNGLVGSFASFILMCSIVFLFGTPRAVFAPEADGKTGNEPAREG